MCASGHNHPDWADKRQGGGGLGGQVMPTQLPHGNTINTVLSASIVESLTVTGVLTAEGVLDIGTGGYMKSGATAYNAGTGFWMEYNAGTPRFFIGNSSANKLTWDGSVLTVNGALSGTITTPSTNISLQSFTTSCVFTSTNNTTVSWGTGSIKFAGGTTYSITAGNTGVMAALTYVYLDIAVSTTALQVTTTYSTAVGDGKRVIACAQNNATGGASVIVFDGSLPLINGNTQITAASILAGNIAASTITANEIAASTITGAKIAAGTITASNIAASTITTTQIAANTIVAGNIAAGTITTTQIAASTITGGNIAASTITASNLSVTTLSAITANMGTLTAGTITGGTIQTAASPAARIQMDTSFLAGYSDATTKQFYLDATTGKAYAGGGNVTLSSTGLSLVGSGSTHSQSTSLSFVNFGNETAYLEHTTASVSHSLTQQINAMTGLGSYLHFIALSPTNYGGTVRLYAGYTGNETWLEVNNQSATSSQGVFSSSSFYCGTTSGGLHVGGTSDPGNDNLVVDGKVGIGTGTEVVDKLEVVGGIHTSGTAAASKQGAAFLDYYSGGSRWLVRGAVAGTYGTISLQSSRGDGTGTRDTLFVTAAGNLGVNTTTSSCQLAINGGVHVGGDSDAGNDNLLVDANTTTAALWVTTAKTPASATDTGTTGQICWDGSGYFYICIATNTWRRLGPGAVW